MKVTLNLSLEIGRTHSHNANMSDDWMNYATLHQAPPLTVIHYVSILEAYSKQCYLQGCTDAMGGPGRCGWASIVTVFLA
jgi:hypothetical protein